MTKKELAFVQEATKILLAEDVVSVARKRRNDFKLARKRRFRSEVDSVLKDQVDTVKTELLPLLVELPQPTFMSDKAFDTNNLSRVWIDTFLRAAACTNHQFKTIAKHMALSLLKTAKSPTFQERIVLPLENFQAPRDFRIAMPDSFGNYACRIISLPNPMRPDLLGHNTFPDESDYSGMRFFPGMLPFATMALVIDRKVERKPKSDNDNTIPNSQARDLAGHVVTAFRLFKEGNVGSQTHFYSNDLVSAFSYMIGSSHGQVVGGKKYCFADDEITKFQKWWRLFARQFPLEDCVPPRLALAISYFESSYSKLADAKFLDLSIALESLFAIDREQTYRLPLRVSSILGRTKQGALEIYDNVKGLWETRNKIAHGNKKIKSQQFSKTLANQIPLLQSIVRQTIHWHFGLFEELGKSIPEYDKTIEKSFERKYIVGRSLKSLD